jgi:hypothetical protein
MKFCYRNMVPTFIGWAFETQGEFLFLCDILTGGSVEFMLDGSAENS